VPAGSDDLHESVSGNLTVERFRGAVTLTRESLLNSRP
jgi:hypothetical protein